jgi:diguanylate cyclase (GGDEF)-like protein
MNFTLKQKIFLGYIVMISFTLIVGGYAIWSLQKINKITTSIIYSDVAAAEKLKKLNDSILGQDLYEKRYLSFQKSEAANFFWIRSREFRSMLSDLINTEAYLKDILQSITSYHDNYNSIFKKESSFIKKRKIKEAETLSSTELKASFNKILLSLKDIDLKIKEQQKVHINKSSSLSKSALMITILLSIVSAVFAIFLASFISAYLNTAIIKLKEATDSIRSGNFDNLLEIKGADELADLAISFKEMSARLKELEAMNIDANPLTKLPGNLAIEKELLTRLNETTPFSFCLIDLDNFKAYSDRYGYSKGSDVLKWLGDLLLNVKKDFGTEEDFLGHIGGDDYVIICSPERVHSICSKIIEDFDKGIIEHYDPEDAKKGFIIVDRNDKPAMFGVMTVSIAVVNTDRTLIREPMEVAQKVAELKQYAKTYAKSIFIMDRRRSR